MTDKSNLSMPPILMAAQIAREMLDYPTYPPWRTDEPTVEGFYLVRCEIANPEGFDYKPFVRIERWNNGWQTLGGYVLPIQWMNLPPV